MKENVFSNSLGSFALALDGILVVFGATDNQGGSVINAVLNEQFAAPLTRIHAITRDPSIPAAVAFAKKGAIVLQVCWRLSIEGASLFLQDGMSQNARWIAEWRFFGDVEIPNALDDGHKVYAMGGSRV